VKESSQGRLDPSFFRLLELRREDLFSGGRAERTGTDIAKVLLTLCCLLGDIIPYILGRPLEVGTCEGSQPQYTDAMDTDLLDCTAVLGSSPAGVYTQAPVRNHGSWTSAYATESRADSSAETCANPAP
jgi:hypothetical protein